MAIACIKTNRRQIVLIAAIYSPNMEKNRIIEIKNRGNWYELNSRRVEAGNLTYSEKKQFLKEFKEFELLCNKTWAAYTKNDRPEMMRLFARVGAMPYHYDLEHDAIWFRKVR